MVRDILAHTNHVSEKEGYCYHAFVMSFSACDILSNFSINRPLQVFVIITRFKG